MNIGEFLHFRVHTDELDLGLLLEFLTEQAHIDFVVKEYGKGNREHIHSCIKLKCPKQTFVDRMKKKFPIIKGNGYYSLGKLKKDYDTNARYCYKGTASDYPDILKTIHTESEWKAYYKAYWEQFSLLLKAKSDDGNMGLQKDTLLLAKAKTKTKTFTQKILDEIFDEHEPIVKALWYYKGYKQDPKNPPPLTYEEVQNFLADYLIRKLGKTAKAIDKFIFERIYKSLWAGILVECPQNLTKPMAMGYLDNFRHEL